MLLQHLRSLRYALPLGGALSASVLAARQSRPVHNEAAKEPRMIISKPDVFARKWKKFCTDGLDKLIVIADFDQTLTPCFRKSGERALSSHSALMTSPLMDPAVREQETKLFHHYYPIEMSPTLTQEEKLPYMLEWWTRQHDVLVEAKLHKQLIVDAVTKCDLIFRDGFHEIFRVLKEENVPTLVFSAGLYDVIHAALDKEFRALGWPTTPSNVHVVSNMMKFNEQGVITSFQGSVIHCFNKNASVLIGTEFHRQCQLQQRRNIILLGDSLGDVTMASGLDVTEDEIIRVGFLNVHVEESMEQYLDKFDIVLTNDASLYPVELLIHQIQ
ncbi:hypothetical protein Poli38472_009485 [Pythium oligandrum]|uniref:5'-nucleotidase n=1 Tax=Pythium oligandrum TaxID=41045 RepID=A0A8K1CH12_PYTOL|nr:hypothetical protein Poli38472_009485 [Pythium oligandrum]|eukprot:TMW61992.1 hypothetical protein Poli38472_009485 [Pythium oligandrum]